MEAFEEVGAGVVVENSFEFGAPFGAHGHPAGLECGEAGHWYRGSGPVAFVPDGCPFVHPRDGEPRVDHADPVGRLKVRVVLNFSRFERHAIRREFVPEVLPERLKGAGEVALPPKCVEEERPDLGVVGVGSAQRELTSNRLENRAVVSDEPTREGGRVVLKAGAIDRGEFGGAAELSFGQFHGPDDLSGLERSAGLGRIGFGPAEAVPFQSGVDGRLEAGEGGVSHGTRLKGQGLADGASGVGIGLGRSERRESVLSLPNSTT